MRKITFILSFLILSVGVFAQTTWKADPFHSKLGFTVTHLGIADVPGHFDNYNVTITASKDDFSDAVVELAAQTASINTRVAPRDKHLKSADFFDAEKHPTMTFRSTPIKKAGKNSYKLSGDLTLRSIIKPVTVDMLYRGTTANPNANGAPVAGIQIIGTIKRFNFGLGKVFPAPMISNEVKIKADGEFGQKEK